MKLRAFLFFFALIVLFFFNCGASTQEEEEIAESTIRSYGGSGRKFDVPGTCYGKG